MSATTLQRVGGSRSGEQVAPQIKGPQQRVRIRCTKQERYPTTLEFCCAAKMPTQIASRQASALDPVAYPDSRNSWLGREP